MSKFDNKNLNRTFSPYPLLSIGILLFAVSVYFMNTYHYHIERWDDAYITYRFAHHLADGLGLIWNIGGKRVEGFTSLLHVSLLSLGIRAGINPWLGSLIISVVSVLATIFMMLLIVRQQVGSIDPLAATVIGIYLVDAATAIHTTSGLETQVFVLVLCICYFLALQFIETSGWWSAMWLGIFVFLSCICRPEAVIYGAGLYLALAVYCLISGQNQGSKKEMLMKLTLSSGVVVFLGLAYVVWKLNYFGYILPNPYYVKSNKLSLAGLPEVTSYVKHLLKWFVPIFLAGFLLLFTNKAKGQSGIAKVKGRIADILSALGNGKTRAKVLLTLTPPILALAYYSTIIHEVGGAYRFSYPTYFYFVLALAIFLSVLIGSAKLNKFSQIILVTVIIFWFGILFVSQKSWQISPAPVNEFNIYHFKIAHALKNTGIGSQGTVLCDAAGIIPYISGFNQLDRVGLASNYLSGRKPLTLEEREAYVWSQPIDVYIGNEPPAQIGKENPEDDAQMKTQYVSEILLRRKLKLVESRIFVQDPQILHSRMRELRDNWHLVGELNWAGWDMWKLKSFVYVRRNSPHSQKLITELNKITEIKPQQIDLNNIN